MKRRRLPDPKITSMRAGSLRQAVTWIRCMRGGAARRSPRKSPVRANCLSRERERSGLRVVNQSDPSVLMRIFSRSPADVIPTVSLSAFHSLLSDTLFLPVSRCYTSSGRPFRYRERVRPARGPLQQKPSPLKDAGARRQNHDYGDVAGTDSVWT